MENNIRGPQEKAIGYGDSMQRVNYQISLYSPYENKKIERRVRKRHQKISGEVGNLERTKNVQKALLVLR